MCLLAKSDNLILLILRFNYLHVNIWGSLQKLLVSKQELSCALGYLFQDLQWSEDLGLIDSGNRAARALRAWCCPGGLLPGPALIHEAFTATT